ncbi:MULTISPECIES: YeeE/YedE family protein [unclassified Aureimonas]|uniref:YeeE/YedE family protein n=1 Tax=unclassified Aureimonas TaxID=2615206 RepID=UPI0006F7F958|nr:MULTISPECIES: YeeE/YedE family protein [unclassified Aureimonas]KQT70074.1 YeeE/YedE family protein [Aureimonas sp. Leaf427]KQT75991.1 YeeE/YedE family protein [Aureimonas sp. Leaf460]
MEHFTPVSALSGGLLIGLSAAILFLMNGRIAGISGILGGALRPAAGEFGWQIAFLVGLLAAAPLLVLSGYEMPAVSVDAALPVVVAGGLLVGFGTRLGSGCTSGHGVCGIGRGSGRSIVATVTFMAAAAATVFLARHVVGA